MSKKTSQSEQRNSIHLYEFPQYYSTFSDHTPQEKNTDISYGNQAHNQNRIITRVYKYLDNDAIGNAYLLKIYSPKVKVTISRTASILEKMGFQVNTEDSFKMQSNEKIVFMHRYNLLLLESDIILDAIQIKYVEEVLSSIFNSSEEPDILLRLSYLSRFNLRDILVMQAYVCYLKQTRFIYHSDVVKATMIRYYNISRLLFDLFITKFDPHKLPTRNKQIDKLQEQLQIAIAEIKNDNHGTKVMSILRVLINGTVRTNFFCTDENGQCKQYLSLKFKGELTNSVIKDALFAETFIFSDSFEAIHLRGGKVSRGGIRWSDREEDYRTEVMGLVLTQVIKNSIIVPTGSKGGFVIKKNKLDRAFAIECYRNFLRGMLDITDNIVNGKIIIPKNIIAYDEPDPYLVVAADKGTATFSDYANEISIYYKYWLHDAFASGGSQGYDHKKLAITSSGAWVSVKNHCHEIGIDPEKDIISVVGIGGMNGDVFGNGVLLQKNLRLIAAFNHLHIFVDPNPDIEKSYAERQRLFSTLGEWSDYNKSLISKGGGVFERKVSSIILTPEIKQVLKIDSETNHCNPEDLIKAILKVKVDLLWNGGIGTFVKGEHETNESVNDKFNDYIRVNGKEIGARIIAEGGNVGITQRGRIEYDINGGMINTDAIDNSGGVSCSDHEVNIKIALNKALADRHIKYEERNSVLQKMTDEVKCIVLRDNYLQNKAISIAKYSDVNNGILKYDQLIKTLLTKGFLKNEHKYLPTSQEIATRHATSTQLTRPEIAVLLSYSKIDIYTEICTKDELEEEHFQYYLKNYFPSPMRNKFKDYINNHPLKREIIATILVDEFVDRIGITAAQDIVNVTNAEYMTVIKAYEIIKKIFGIDKLWDEIEQLDGRVNPKVQYDMYSRIAYFVQRAMHRLITMNNSRIDSKKFIQGIGSIIAKLNFITLPNANQIYGEYFDKTKAWYITNGVSSHLAENVSLMMRLRSLISIAGILHTNHNPPMALIISLYHSLDALFHLNELKNNAYKMRVDNYWEWVALMSTINAISEKQSEMCSSLFQLGIKLKLKDPRFIFAKFEEIFKKELDSYNLFYRNNKEVQSSMVAIASMTMQKLSFISEGMYRYLHG